MTDTRMMCRDQEGHFRLMPGVNIMDALDKLGEIEERALGVLTVRSGFTSRRCGLCIHYQGPEHGPGPCGVKPNRQVYPSLIACKRFERKDGLTDE